MCMPQQKFNRLTSASHTDDSSILLNDSQPNSVDMPHLHVPRYLVRKKMKSSKIDSIFNELYKKTLVRFISFFYLFDWLMYTLQESENLNHHNPSIPGVGTFPLLVLASIEWFFSFFFFKQILLGFG